MESPVLKRDAVLSPDGRYRYRLERYWALGEAEPLVYCLLNPSTADAQVDDPTIRVCCGRARRLFYPGIMVVNLFALRATDPADLRQAILEHGHAHALGPDNRHHLEQAFAGRDVVLGWGVHGPELAPKWNQVVRGLAERTAHAVFAIRRLRDGAPAHPLRNRYDSLVAL